MINNEKFVVAPKDIGGLTDPMQIIESVGKFEIAFSAECDAKFAQKVLRLIDAEKSKNKAK